MRDPQGFMDALDDLLVRVEDERGKEVVMYAHPVALARYMRHIEWWNSLPWWNYRKLWARVRSMWSR